MFANTGNVNKIRAMYPEGCIVRMVCMQGDPRPVPAGTTGKVICVDDAGTVHTNWEDGRTLGFVPGVDEVEIITKA